MSRVSHCCGHVSAGHSAQGEELSPFLLRSAQLTKAVALYADRSRAGIYGVLEYTSGLFLYSQILSCSVFIPKYNSRHFVRTFQGFLLFVFVAFEGLLNTL